MARTSTAKKSTTSSSSRTSGRSTGRTKTAANTNVSSQGDMMQKLFLDSIKDMYWAEKHLVKALAKMQKSATSEQLQNAFEDHIAATETHVARLEQVFELLGETARGKKCEAMEGLIAEAKSLIDETEKMTETRDVALILAAQKVEHYEIASYGTLTTLAKMMGQVDIANLLGKTLAEEKETDDLLTQIAENDINFQAIAE